MKNTNDTFNIITMNKQDIYNLNILHLAIAYIGDADGQVRDAIWPDIGQIHMICNLRCYFYVKNDVVGIFARYTSRSGCFSLKMQRLSIIWLKRKSLSVSKLKRPRLQDGISALRLNGGPDARSAQIMGHT